MANQQPRSKKARREAARRAARRRRLLTVAAVVVVSVIGLGAVIVSQGGSDGEVAALAPDFELETNAGETVRLSDFRGQPVAVTFMHTY